MHTKTHILMLFMFTALLPGLIVSSWRPSSEEAVWYSGRVLEVLEADFGLKIEKI